MSRTTSHNAVQTRILVAITAVCIAFGATGCEQIDARRSIQKGNELYKAGKFFESVQAFEAGLAKAPQLEIGHHNLGLAYFKMFKPGDESAANKSYADKATEHLSKWLDSNPDDGVIVGLVTRIWMDSGNYQEALRYWENELAKNPKDGEVIRILASVNRQSGDWEAAIRWHRREAEASDTPAGKVDAYLSIAKLAWSKLSNRDKVVGEERLKIADMGLAALQTASELAKDNIEIAGYMASLFEFRSLAHGAIWAQLFDRASTQHYRGVWRDLNEAARKAAEAQNPATPSAPDQPASPDEKSGG